MKWPKLKKKAIEKWSYEIKKLKNCEEITRNKKANSIDAL